MNKQIETMKQVVKVFNGMKQIANRNDDMGVVKTDIESEKRVTYFETFTVTVDEAGKMNIDVFAKGETLVEKKDVTLEEVKTELENRIKRNSK